MQLARNGQLNRKFKFTRSEAEQALAIIDQFSNVKSKNGAWRDKLPNRLVNELAEYFENAKKTAEE